MRRTASQLALSPHVLRLEEDGTTHRRDCECARCEAGFVLSEAQRREAALQWQRHKEQERAREAAEKALERRRERARKKALMLQLSLLDERRRANDFVAAQEQILARLHEDERLDALLSLRRAGRPIAEALDEVDRRFPPQRKGTSGS